MEKESVNKTINATFSKRGKNLHNVRFGVYFAEWLPSSPRWHMEGKNKHYKHIKKMEPIDRDPDVIHDIVEAHTFAHDSAHYLVTCVNPQCSKRDQTFFSRDELGKDTFTRNSLEREACKVARGEKDELTETCKTCQGKVLFFPVMPVSNRWIYVLYESGNKLVPHCEIRIGEDRKGEVYLKYEKGDKRFSEKVRKNWEGHLVLENVTSPVWHFFMSGIRLGEKSLDMLIDSKNSKEEVLSGFLLSGLQPYATTVKRKFTEEQIKEGKNEAIPLLSPFEWTGYLLNGDVFPIIHAQDSLENNPNERSKQFIASTLSKLVCKKLVRVGPPEEFEEDPWDVKDDLVPPPAEFRSSDNVAQAWIDRYAKGYEFLIEESDDATKRVYFVAQKCLSFKIIDRACHEDDTDIDKSLERIFYGLSNWFHVLRFCRNTGSGDKFAEWILDQKGIFPVDIIFHDDKASNKAKSYEEFGQLCLGIINILLPAFIKKEKDQAANKLVVALHRIGHTDASVSANKDIKMLKEVLKTTKKLGTSALEQWLKKIATPGVASSRLGQWMIKNDAKPVIDQCLGRMEYLVDSFSLLIGFYDFYKAVSGKKDYQNRWVVDDVKKMAELPIKLSDFILKLKREQMRGKLMFNPGIVLDDPYWGGFEGIRKLDSTIEKKGIKAVTGDINQVIENLEFKELAVGLNAAEAEMLVGYRSIRMYTTLWKVGKVFTGYAGFVLGGMSLVVDARKALDAADAGDTGGAIGQGMIALSSVGFMITAGAEIYLLHAGAGAAAAGSGAAGVTAAIPYVGAIAALLLIAGGAVYAYCSKEDLELYALHCWLGNEYGGGSWEKKTDKAWMGPTPWPALRYVSEGMEESKDRWNLQATALRRIISNYTVSVTYLDYCSGNIWVSGLPEGMVFEVEISLHLLDGPGPSANRVPDRDCSYKAKIWPLERLSIWENLPKEGPNVLDKEFSRIYFRSDSKSNALTNIKIVAKPHNYGNPVYAKTSLSVRAMLSEGSYIPVSKDKDNIFITVKNGESINSMES